MCLRPHFQISELEGLNFSLEEQLMEVQGEEGEEVDGGECEGGGGRGRSATLIEAALQERDEDIGQLSAQLAEREHQLQQMRAELTSTHHALHTLSPLPALLQQQVVAETEAKAAVYFNCLHMQVVYIVHCMYMYIYGHCFVYVHVYTCTYIVRVCLFLLCTV